MSEPQSPRGFYINRAEPESRRPQYNPYVALHRELGFPVIPAEQAASLRDTWPQVFGADLPLHLEVGSGNGFFLSGMAARHPEAAWVGVEIRYKRVVLCARKILEADLENARIVRYDAWCLHELFSPGSLAGLYVNHPDPWPKERDAKKRLLGPHFVRWAADALAPGASFRLKTDFEPNVELLLESAADLPFEVMGRTSDIRATGSLWGEDDVITNYQRKFYQRGLPVHALWLRRR